MKRLCYLTNVRIPTEKAHGVQIFKMCEAFARCGYDVTLAVSDRRTPITEEPFTYYGAAHSFGLERIASLDLVRFGRLGFLVQSLTFAWSALRYLQRTRPDVVYTRDPLVVLAALAARIPLAAWEVHTTAWNAFARRAAKKSTVLVAISQGLMDFYQGHGVAASRMLRANDGVDLEDFLHVPSREEMRITLGLPPDRTIIEYVGKLRTMGEGKGVEELMEAVGAILSKNPALYLVIVGLNENELTDAAAIAERAGLGAGDYRFVAHVAHPEVAGYLRAADVLVMNYPNTPHYARIMSPLKLFEYMASGTAILTSDLPSIREVLTDETAYFIEADARVALEEGILTLSRDPEMRTRLAHAAWQEVQTHTWESRANQIRSFMEAA